MNTDIKEQLLRVVRIEDVISRYLTLRRAGSSKKTWVGLCPFHEDSHPSLHVNTRDQYYKCFACGEGGDAFKFVQKVENCSFPEVLKRMAGWYGLTDDSTPPPTPLRQETAPMAKMVLAWDDDVMRRMSEAAHRTACSILPYTPENPVLSDTYLRFGVGVVPDSMLTGFGFLRNRLAFPIRNEAGEVIAFSGRYLGDARRDRVAKYMNSPGSPLYRKGEILYGLHESKESIAQHRFVYITEGYKDVLAMHAAGFTNTVGLCGVVLTDDHMELLHRYTNHIVLMLDGDKAGYQASDWAAASLRKSGFVVSQIFIFPMHDPDSLLEELGVEAFAGYIRKVTRQARMEAYEFSLAVCVSRLLEELKLALRQEERLVILPQLIKVRCRLARVTEMLGHGVVMSGDQDRPNLI